MQLGVMIGLSDSAGSFPKQQLVIKPRTDQILETITLKPQTCLVDQEIQQVMLMDFSGLSN